MSAEVSEERIRGEHVASYAQSLEQQDPETYKKVFSKYLERGLEPKNLPSHFQEVLSKIKEADS